MRLLLGSLFAFAIAAAIGLGLTWTALTHGTAYGGVTIGAWTAWPKNGTPGIDPYARAIVARSGELPIGSGDGVAFFARTDGTFEITIGPRARPGNWLPTGGIERYMLVLRLYDTPIGLATRSGREAPMPTIVQKACP